MFVKCLFYSKIIQKNVNQSKMGLEAYLLTPLPILKASLSMQPTISTQKGPFPPYVSCINLNNFQYAEILVILLKLA